MFNLMSRPLLLMRLPNKVYSFLLDTPYTKVESRLLPVTIFSECFPSFSEVTLVTFGSGLANWIAIHLECFSSVFPPVLSCGQVSSDHNPSLKAHFNAKCKWFHVNWELKCWKDVFAQRLIELNKTSRPVKPASDCSFRWQCQEVITL